MYRRIEFLLLLAPAIAAGSNCSRTTTGFKPLNAPFFTNYHGFAGGLYPGNSNARPLGHESGGRTQAASVRPRDAAGNPNDTNGRIVLLSIGMSNTTQEFSAFQSLAGHDPDKNPNVVLVDGAQGGWSADRIVADPTTYWNGVEQRIVMSGVSDAQVQAAWVKLADATPTLPFPDDARKLQSETQQIIQMARSRFPNLRLVYLSSRIYAGYADTNLNPEPYAYQGGFAMKWLIEAQIDGSQDLDYSSAKFPWLAWGPYLWADGTTPRNDGLSWACADLQSDGTHPSAAGQMKVARMLLDFFKSDTTARPWFVAAALQIATLPQPSTVVNAAGFFATIAPGGIATVFGSDLASSTVAASGLPLPYGIAGTSVAAGGEPAPIYFVSPSQINFVVPPGVDASMIAITREGTAAASITAVAALNSAGLFTLGNTSNAAAIHADGTIVSAQNPAHRGETIALYGTGKGVRNPAILTPEFLPIVTVGGIAAQVQYYGPAPIYPGMDQLNITIPPDAPAGGSVTVVVQLGGFSSNAVTLAIV
jgi:uncharacterized protein (TIGR03437 family)